jgi:AraC-like DNA-binding protein
MQARLPVSTEDPVNFKLVHRWLHLGDLTAHLLAHGPLQCQATAPVIDTAAWRLIVVLCGTLRLDVQDAFSCRLAPHDVALVPGDAMARYTTSEGARAVIVDVPPTHRLATEVLDHPWSCNKENKAASALACEVVSFFRRTPEHLTPQVRAHYGERVEKWIERTSTWHGEQCAAEPEGDWVVRLASDGVRDRVLAVIRSRWADPDLNAERIGRVLGVSSRTVQRAFEGQTAHVADMIRGERVQRAVAALTSEKFRDTSVEDIAHQVGFGSGAGLRRAMRTEIGQSPEQVRADLRRRWVPQLAARQHLD